MEPSSTGPTRSPASAGPASLARGAGLASADPWVGRSTPTGRETSSGRRRRRRRERKTANKKERRGWVLGDPAPERVPIRPYRVPRAKKWPEMCRTWCTKCSTLLLLSLLVVQYI